MRLLLPFLLLLAGPARAVDPDPGPGQQEVDAFVQALGTMTGVLDAMLEDDPDRAVRDPDVVGAVTWLDAALRRGAELALGREDPALDAALDEARATLVRARIARLGAFARDRPADALDEGEQLLHTLRLVAEAIGAEPDLDPIRVRLVRTASALGDRPRALAWAADCETWCTTEAARAEVHGIAVGEGTDALGTFGGTPSGDGRVKEEREDLRDEAALLRWRLGASWTVPAGQSSVDGLPVRRSAAAGQAAFALAPTAIGCVELGGGWDSWTVPGHEDGLGQRRWRAELGWCPALLVGRKGPLTAALRVVVGGGVAGGQIVLADAPDRPVLGAGPFLRVEIPVRIGIAELGFRVGWAPYGRGGESFVRPMSAGLGVAIGRRPHTKAE